MTNIASLDEMHCTLVSFVRRCVCTQNLVLKIERVVRCVQREFCKQTNKQTHKQKQQKKKN